MKCVLCRANYVYHSYIARYSKSTWLFINFGHICTPVQNSCVPLKIDNYDPAFENTAYAGDFICVQSNFSHNVTVAI